ncbi:hypothetical protein GCM10028812_10680 [Ancylobacter sonchi]
MRGSLLARDGQREGNTKMGAFVPVIWRTAALRKRGGCAGGRRLPSVAQRV